MSYKSPEYYALQRNVAKRQAILRHVDNARTFNSLRYVEGLTLSGRTRDGTNIEIAIDGGLMQSVLDLCANRSVEAAKSIQGGEWEADDFEKASKV